MKLKVQKTEKSSASKLLDIRKTNSDVRKAKKPNKELKTKTVKVATSSVGAPLNFAENIVSVKSKANAAKVASNTTSTAPTTAQNGALNGAKKGAKKKASAKNAPNKPEQANDQEAGKGDDKQNPLKETNGTQLTKAKKRTAKAAKVSPDTTSAAPTAEQNAAPKKAKTVAKKKASAKFTPTKSEGDEENESGKKDDTEPEKKDIELNSLEQTGGVTKKKRKAKSAKVKSKTIVSTEKKDVEQNLSARAERISKWNQIGKKIGDGTWHEPDERVKELLPKELVTVENFKASYEFVQKKALALKENALFGDELKYGLQVTGVKTPSCPSCFVRITLPHSLIRPEDGVCLIVLDLDHGYRTDNDATKRYWWEVLKDAGVDDLITEIIPFRELRNNYPNFELKTVLAKSYGRFLVDCRISGHVFGFLGKPFLSRNKVPVPIRVHKLDELKRQVSQGVRKETFYRTNQGEVTYIKFAANWMPVEHAVKNGIALIRLLKKHHIGGWANIKMIRLQTATSDPVGIFLYKSSIPSDWIETPVHIGPRQRFIEKQKQLILRATGGKYTISDKGVLIDVASRGDNSSDESDYE